MSAHLQQNANTRPAAHSPSVCQAVSENLTIPQYRQWLAPLTNRARQDRCGFKAPSGVSGWGRHPLDATRINEHFAGTTGCGVGFIIPGTSTTRLALLDLDDHRGDTPADTMTATAGALCVQLEVFGIQPTVFKSSGGRGLHIWMLWDSEQDAYSVRHALQRMLHAVGCREGSGGVADGQVEIFPKQASVNFGAHGNMAILPLWNRSVPMINEFGLGLLKAAPRESVTGMVWPMSIDVPVVAHAPRATVTGKGAAAPEPIDKVERALAAIPNGHDGPDYIEWFKLLCAVREATGASNAGFELFKSWTAQHPANKAPLQRGKWDQKDNGGVTRGTLFSRANECSPAWDAPTPDGLDDVVNLMSDVAPGGALALSDDDAYAATSDVGNGRELALMMSGRFKYVHNGGGWCEYRAGVYRACTQGEHIEIAKRLGPAILASTKTSNIEDVKKAFVRAQRAMSVAGLDAALKMGQSDPKLATSPTGMDSDPDMLNAQNCIVHLPTGEARAHDPSIMMAKQCTTVYDPAAVCPRFDKFMAQISVNDPDWVDYIQRLIGYTINGNVNEELVIFMIGVGANGKSVFANVMRRILAGYSDTIPANLLMVSTRDSEAATPSLATLPGVRMAQANEVEAGSRLSAQAVKQVASSDAITARHLYGKKFTFTPSHTVWVRGNHRPLVTDTDDGIWRRICLVPFDARFGPDEKDVHLEEKLMAEAPGILAWMVRGHLAYKRRGLTPAKRVAAASDAYRKDSDIVAQWVGERTKQTTHGVGWAQREAYQDYREWCGEQGLFRPMTKRSFTLSLIERGIREGREGSGSRIHTYAGIESSRGF